MDIEKIGLFIKKLRKEKNISQNQLSEEIHVTRQAISAWENGKAVPDSDILLVLSSYFDVSINEILLGKRLTEKEGLEEIALQLIDENNNKKRKINKLIVSFTTVIAIFLIMFLGYYFINNYNSIKVYKVYGKSTNFKTNNGIFIMTNKKVYLRLGKISQYRTTEKNKINKVKLYYIDNKKEYVLFEENKIDILIDEDYGYKEFFLNNDMNTAINNMYLEITYNENEKQTIKLNILEQFKNSFKSSNKNFKVNALKDEMYLKDFKKQDELINKLIEEARIKVDEQIRIRKELDSNNPKEEKEENNYKEETNYVDYYIEEKVNEPIIQEIKVSEETNNNYEVLPDEEPIEEVQNKIDYDKIITIIKENGINQGGTYIYEFMEGDIFYSTCYENGMITIGIFDNNVLEYIQLYTETNMYYYQKLVDYCEETSELKNIYDNEELIIRINKMFNL